MEIDELVKAGLTGWPLAFAAVGIAVCFVSLFVGWPWRGIISINKCSCKHDNEDEDDE